MKKLLLAGLMSLTLAGVFSPQAHAGPLTVTFTQVGSNVVATASGSIDLTGLSLHQSGFGDCASVQADVPGFDVGGNGPCNSTTPGVGMTCPSGQTLTTFSGVYVSTGTVSGMETGYQCANTTPADLYEGLITMALTYDEGFGR